MITDTEKIIRLTQAIERADTFMRDLAEHYAANPEIGPYSLAYSIVANCRMNLRDNISLAQQGAMVLGDEMATFEQGLPPSF